ncbi:MAG: winged helix-turn-helix transcriptional regulator [Acidobacteriota bacterium]|nr:winged helix-turn-helix transcriptional regulator [Acidobacteriota bacterium]
MKEQLRATPEGEALVLVFPPVQLVDSSFADESIVRLGAEILKDKYGERCILLEGLTSDSIKNFNAVISLRRIKLPLLAVNDMGEWQILGGLEESLTETLKLVQQRGHLTAADLVAQLGMAVNTASTRLKRLHNLHLVRREFEVSEKGLQYFYYFWQWSGSK